MRLSAPIVHVYMLCFLQTCSLLAWRPSRPPHEIIMKTASGCGFPRSDRCRQPTVHTGKLPTEQIILPPGTRTQPDVFPSPQTTRHSCSYPAVSPGHMYSHTRTGTMMAVTQKILDTISGLCQRTIHHEPELHRFFLFLFVFFYLCEQKGIRGVGLGTYQFHIK
jgi:hypothetical protein